MLIEPMREDLNNNNTAKPFSITGRKARNNTKSFLKDKNRYWNNNSYRVCLAIPREEHSAIGNSLTFKPWKTEKKGSTFRIDCRKFFW